MKTTKLLSFYAAARRRWRDMVAALDHQAVLDEVDREGHSSFHYLFMIVVATGIAISGLLMNSPAVIIGAMLVSPLMGPIVRMGFALTTLDLERGRQGLGALMLGGALALASAAVITSVSPLKLPTEEILARVRPNLFDLLVALLSGAAGGYAMIRGRGGAIVGVAIATALLPPMAVVGYGLATVQWPIAGGALLLFVTNLISISLAVALVAVWYGFGQGKVRHQLTRQALVGLAVLLPLVFPLFFSLKSIAWETYATTVIRKAVDRELETRGNASIVKLDIQVREGDAPRVRLVAVASEPDPDLEQKLTRSIEQELGQKALCRVDQVLLSDYGRFQAEKKRRDSLESAILAIQEREHLADAIRGGFPAPLRGVEVNDRDRYMTLMVGAASNLPLQTYRDLQLEMERRYTGWRVSIIPPARPLPPIPFARQSAKGDQAGWQALNLATWALSQWGVKQVEVTGYAARNSSTARRLARKRADWVADALQRTGFEVLPVRVELSSGQAGVRLQPSGQLSVQ